MAAKDEGLTAEQKQRIKDAIGRAQSLEEIQKLELILQSGKMPKDFSEPAEKTAEKPAEAAAVIVDAMDVSK